MKACIFLLAKAIDSALVYVRTALGTNVCLVSIKIGGSSKFIFIKVVSSLPFTFNVSKNKSSVCPLP